MKIKFLTGPNAGKFDHAEWSQATALQVKLGNIEIVPIPPYGSIGHNEARQEEERFNHPECFLPPVITWGLLHDSRATIIQKTVNGNVFRFDSPPADCPPKIVAQFRSYLRDFAKEQAELEKRKNEIAESDARAASARRW